VARQLDPIDRYLTRITGFARANTQSELLGLVRAALPPELALRCLGATLAQDCLTIVAPSSAWASRLRYSSAAIQAHLHGAGVTVARLVVKISPQRSVKVREMPKPKAISSSSASSLRHAAACVDDDELATALRRLAAHGDK
jgi:hypothetical protein